MLHRNLEPHRCCHSHLDQITKNLHQNKAYICRWLSRLVCPKSYFPQPSQGSKTKSNRLPDLFADVTHGLQQGRSIDPFTNSYINQQIFFGNYGLGTSVVLFSGKQLSNLVKQNQLGQQAAKMELQQTNDDIMLNVLLAYLQVLNNKEQLTQAQNQFELTRKQVARLHILDSQGAIIPAQLYDLKGQLAGDQLLVINAGNAMETAKLTLAQLMNMPYDKNMQVEQITAADLGAKYEGTTENIYNQAVAQLAIIK
ncbi:MAG: hypothetical protein EOO88_59200, partial [Pedobacter sp.]